MNELAKIFIFTVENKKKLKIKNCISTLDRKTEMTYHKLIWIVYDWFTRSPSNIKALNSCSVVHMTHFWNNILRVMAHLKKCVGVQLPW